MRPRSPADLFVVLAAASLAGCAPDKAPDPLSPTGIAADVARPDALLAEGRTAYVTYCIGCHGASGDGNGEAARFMIPRPRNFQAANFKFSSTRSGNLPTDADLRRTIVAGLRGSAMPRWDLLPERTVTSLIAYLKTFSPKWTERSPAGMIPRVDDPYRSRPDKSAAIARGEAVYHGFSTCWTCHPAYVPIEKINEYLTQMENPSRDAFRQGLFDSEAKVSSEGETVFPPDFKRDFVRGGMTTDDLYRSIAAGITGTAMPTWVDSMDVQSAHGGVLTRTNDIWAMAYYVHDLIRQRPARLPPGQFAVRARPAPIYPPGVLPPAAAPAPADQGKPQEEFQEEGG